MLSPFTCLQSLVHIPWMSIVDQSRIVSSATAEKESFQPRLSEERSMYRSRYKSCLKHHKMYRPPGIFKEFWIQNRLRPSCPLFFPQKLVAHGAIFHTEGYEKWKNAIKSLRALVKMTRRRTKSASRGRKACLVVMYVQFLVTLDRF